jgi:hypothetical protein
MSPSPDIIVTVLIFEKFRSWNFHDFDIVIFTQSLHSKGIICVRYIDGYLILLIMFILTKPKTLWNLVLDISTILMFGDYLKDYGV